jgi:hypothetical protein
MRSPRPGPRPESGSGGGRSQGPRRLYAFDDRDRVCAIALLPLALVSDGERGLPSSRLLSHSPLPASVDPAELLWEFHPSAVAEPGGLVGMGVRRAIGEGPFLPGEVVAIRGAARLDWDLGERSLIVRDLLEIHFHELRTESGNEPETLPPLSAQDAGQLVMTAYGEALGLIVGGSGYRAVAVPVRAYLLQHGLKLADPADFDRRDTSQKRLGRLEHDVDSLFDELGTTPPYPFGDPLEEAA